MMESPSESDLAADFQRVVSDYLPFVEKMMEKGRLTEEPAVEKKFGKMRDLLLNFNKIK